MKTQIDVQVVVRYPDTLGEAPAYDAANSRLVWVDIFGKKVRELRLTDDATWEAGRTWELDGLVSAVVPRAAGGLVVTCGSEFLALSESGSVETLASLEAGHPEGIRFNDAKCDPQGRFLAGWMSYDLNCAGELVRLDPDGSVETILTEVGLSNGLDWSPDGETFYFADSVARTVDAFDYDAAAGRLAGRRPLLSIERGTAPNGLAVDDDGCIWLALPWATEVRRYGPDGELVDTLPMPTIAPTSCAFGGPDRDELFITSAFFKRLKLPKPLLDGVGISDEQAELAREDETGGALYVCRPGVAGPAATPFAG